MAKPAAHDIVVIPAGASRSPVPGLILGKLGEEIVFDREAIQRCSRGQLDALDSDLLIVLASIAFADRRARRDRRHGWGRTIKLTIPVDRLDEWRAIREDLAELLAAVTGDEWEICFSETKGRSPFSQQFIPGFPKEVENPTILPYSGGLDSFATLGLHRLQFPERSLLLVHARHGNASLRSVLPSQERHIPALAVPFRATGGLRAEPSYRTRTLLFFCLSALAWRLTKGSTIWIGESGIGCLGPALLPFGGEPPLRTCHPTFVRQVERFFKKLWGAGPAFELPNLWKTKGEVLASIVSAPGFGDWTRTRSCSRNIARQHPTASRRQCGLCSGCLFRRQSLHAVGLAEPAGTYYADILADSQLPPGSRNADREVATYAVVGLDELALACHRIEGRAAHIHEIATAVELPEREVDARVTRLLSQHANEWTSLIRRLPEGSWARSLAEPGADA